uniref:FAS1 domain-containing protein n=1 Tax=Moniliophthora roreri TaxID=221103 RepID=A0A0W0GCU6_MONRR
MKLVPLIGLVLGPLSVAADLDAFMAELSKTGLTTFSSLLPSIAKTAAGKSLINQLSTSTNFSIFAPTNEALQGLKNTEDYEDLAKIISYHIVHGNYYHAADQCLFAETLPNVTLARTLLNASENETASGKPVKIISTARETTVQAAYLVQGYAVFAVDQIITIPPWLSTILKNKNYYTKNTTSLFATALDNAYTDLPDGKHKSLLQYLSDNYLSGYTLFAPSTDALSKLTSTFPEMKPDEWRDILLNHVINGTTLYTNTFKPSTALTGQSTTFTTNSSGTYVTSGPITAKIIQANLIAKNGVAHVIDTVLRRLPDDYDCGASKAIERC